MLLGLFKKKDKGYRDEPTERLNFCNSCGFPLKPLCCNVTIREGFWSVKQIYVRREDVCPRCKAVHEYYG